MKYPRIPARSLIAKLAVFYAALSLLALLLVKSTILLLEFRALAVDLEHGALAQAVTQAGAELEGDWAIDGRPPAPAFLARTLESLLLRLERPRQDRGGESANILAELASQPLAARIVDAEGRPIATAPAEGTWQADLPGIDESAWKNLRDARGAQLIGGADSPELVRRYAAPLRDRAGALLGVLVVELRLPLPWRQLAQSASFEWPILLTYLVVFSLGSALFLSRYVTRRLNRIGAAASAWSQGDFSPTIADTSTDELGRLAHELNRMAADLRALVQTRAQLATLEERQRLARDLHDTVKQKAFALNLQLATATRILAGAAPAATARIEEARRITEEIQSELVQILDELRTPDSPEALSQNLETRVADFSRRSGIAVDLALDAGAVVPAHQHDAVLRIVDEALANVLRHSGATRATVDLRGERGQLTLRIQDDGRGAAADRGEGMGIRNMRERAAQLPAGRFELSGAADSGTRVTVCWSDHLGSKT